MSKPTISRTTRGVFRDLMTSSTIGQISQAFQDEGFAPNPDCTYQDSSSRRITAEEYLSYIDWDDPAVYPRVIMVFQRLLAGVRPDGVYDHPTWDSFTRLMERDGWRVDEHGGICSKYDPLVLAPEAIAQLKDAGALHEQLERLRRAATADDPAAVIGAAKELVESTAKVVLGELGTPIDENWKFPKLIGEAQQALGLQPSKQTPGPDGTDAVKRILGGATNMVLGLDELRNAGYGTGHGTARARVGLYPRHARLAANAAIAWCELMLDTLTDEAAPWRSTRG